MKPTASPRPWLRRSLALALNAFSLLFFVAACRPQPGESSQAAEHPSPPAPSLPELLAAPPSGYFDAPFTLKLISPVQGAIIRYTLDGAEPAAATGHEYRDSLVLSNTAPVRAAAFKAGIRVSGVTTRTYLCLEETIHQPARPAGFPAGARAWNGEPSAYGMSPDVVNDPAYRDRIEAALRALPALSIVFRQSDLFGARSGIYLNSLQRGETWERPCSVEFIPTNQVPGFQIDCGIRMQGNYNRIPEKSPKHSFRLFFKAKFGASKLRYRLFPDSDLAKFDTLVLRADYNNSWVHWDPSGQERAQRTRDAWMKDSHRAMGWTAAHNRYVHLYLNGLYWGIYDIAERPDANFAAAYLGGRREAYDAINEGQAKDGDRARFNAFQSLRRLDQPAQYDKLRQRLDITNYIDYLLLNYYAGNHDWGENKNWYAIGRRDPPGLFQYFVWDGEYVLQRLDDDIINSPFEIPFRLAEALRANPDFRHAFAERVRKHLLGNGALSPQAAAARWTRRASELDLAIIAESARWGGYRRDPPYTRDRDWLREQHRLLDNYFPRRTEIVLQQLRSAGLYP